ncbi:hypothetical protein LZ30DRAFT_472499 [Colletotrichum cereale]|nr:hypothetical protein LZ30DRAFT_472499 [Colletotrichum cereale]
MSRPVLHAHAKRNIIILLHSRGVIEVGRQRRRRLGDRRHDLFDYPRRVADDAHMVRHVLRHDAPCTDGHAAPDGDARQHDNIAAEVTVVADGDGLSALWPTGAVAQGGVQRVLAAVEAAVGADDGARAHRDEAGVYPRAIGANIHAFAKPILLLEPVRPLELPLDRAWGTMGYTNFTL